MRESLPSVVDELDPPFTVDMELFAAVYRDRMPTWRDWNPLRHDIVIDEKAVASDRRPTLPDIDPLRHDLPS
jgi:hypothetical protein